MQSVRLCRDVNMPLCQKRMPIQQKKVGVEHAGKDTLVEAIENCACFVEGQMETITAADMTQLGLTGDNSQKAREYIGSYFHIGMGNAKTMRRRLNGMQITAESVREALNKWKQE